MSIDYGAVERAGGLGKGIPRKEAKRLRTAKLKTAIKDAYVDVDARDKMLSWVTGRRLVRGGADDKVRIEHHHLDRRSQSKARQADPHNVISVSSFEAEYLDLHYLIPVDKFGEEVHDTRLIADFQWNPRVFKADKVPFKVKATVRR